MTPTSVTPTSVTPTSVRRRVTTVAASLGAAALLATGTSAPAYAATVARTCTASALAAAKTAVGASVSHRDSVISAMAGQLDARPHLSSAHRSTLAALYSADQAGLAQVLARVQADTTCAAASTDAQHIVTDYRVYLLVVPQSGLALGGDVGTYGAQTLTAAEPAVRLAIELLPSGSSKDQAHTLYDDMAAQASVALADFAGVGDAVLALTPADYPGSSATLKAQAARVASGAKSLAAAGSDASQLAALLG